MSGACKNKGQIATVEEKLVSVYGDVESESNTDFLATVLDQFQRVTRPLLRKP